MFTEFDSTMFALFKPLFVLSGIAIVVLLVLVLIIAFFIFIKRVIFGVGDEEGKRNNTNKQDTNSVIGFDLKNNNTRRK